MYDPTREIKIKDSMEQGVHVLSVIQYALVIDEVSKEINKSANNRSSENAIETLLWMDDIVLVTNNIKDMKELLKITDEVANMYHVEFRPEKSNILLVGKDKETIKHLNSI